MSYLALYRKYRPTNFDEMVGQKAVITALQNQVKYGQLGHAYLFCGTRGTGKTSTAKVFARAVNCLHPVNGNPCNECELCKEAESGFNLVEIDAASNNGVENIRDLREEVQYTPSKGQYKVYIIDEVHMLTQSAFNALLKTLEEPPKHVIFILATTEPHKVLPTILSRCQRYDFKRITTAEIADHLHEVSGKEGIQATEEALHYMAALADGGMRDALSILDQCHAYYMQEEITLPKVRDVLGAVDSQVFTQMTQALAEQNAAALLETVAQIFAQGRDAMQFVSAWAFYLRNVLVSRVLTNHNSDLIEADPEQLLRIQKQAEELSADQLTYYIEELAKLEAKLKGVTQKRVVLEVGLISLLHGPEAREVPQPVRRSQPVPARPAAVQPEAVGRPESVREAAPNQAALVEEAKPVRQEVPAIKGIKPSEEVGRVLAKWPDIRAQILKQSPSLQALKFMKLVPGNEGELLLKTPLSVYCRQLEMNEGKNLRLIEDVIEQATGIRLRVRAICEEQRSQPGDLSDIMNQVHTDVNWRN